MLPFGLSEREYEVLMLLNMGFGVREVARFLGISHTAVSHYKNRATLKIIGAQDDPDYNAQPDGPRETGRPQDEPGP